MSRLLGCLAILVGLVCPMGAGTTKGGDAKGKVGHVRELDAKGITAKVEGGSVKMPTVITRVDDLKKVNMELAEKIRAQADLTKEQVLIFSWGGSGQDKLVLAESTGADDVAPKCQFHFTPGRTRDFRPHLHVFAVPLKSTWVVVSGR